MSLVLPMAIPYTLMEGMAIYLPNACCFLRLLPLAVTDCQGAGLRVLSAQVRGCPHSESNDICRSGEYSTDKA
jgi:hypothetical protein